MKMKKWVTAAPNLEAARSLSEACGFSPLAAVALCARGVDTMEKAQAFLATGAGGLHDPMRLRDMDKAVATIREAVRQRQKIIVFGDYDVDGITATLCAAALSARHWRGCGLLYPQPPERRLWPVVRGNGRALCAGVRLIVTVDSGVTAFEETAYAKKLGIRMVITDHHECREELPQAEAIVNPRRSDCDYPFAELAGVGVAFKLICALAGPEHLETVLDKYADLVALGTVADVMPVVGENRVIVAAGLQRLAVTENLGLEMLLRESGQKSRRLTSSVISFILAPRINAAGRMGNTGQAVELFLTDDPVRAQELAAQLCEQNKERQAAENDILQQALAVLRREYNPLEDKMIVLAGEGWHHGVIGIVSSRICDRYACPAILIAVDGDIGKGSGRSMAGFNLFEALSDSAGFDR